MRRIQDVGCKMLASERGFWFYRRGLQSIMADRGICFYGGQVDGSRGRESSFGKSEDRRRRYLLYFVGALSLYASGETLYQVMTNISGAAGIL
ncbi:hypothetical protein AMTR_s00122p00041950 [Amborella trichopoda]|uniref:Uncharacterized protein n=1 Tax=Amborella trichopoda TaxID=13333 RepID=W1NMC0_AMBTC|nr:hypothetical protein AMTR_s00122p00041950 [Amborella trichopoda]